MDIAAERPAPPTPPRSRRSRGFVPALLTTLVMTVPTEHVSAQSRPALDRVLAFPDPVPGEALQVDLGAAGAWHRIRKLTTTSSLLHVVAHPDDEHAGMLTLASRGWGARTALLSLNRGEAGANAIGPELFDALGLIRTRELVLSGRHYGLDDLYFTSAVDYGYSKSLDEAMRSWDFEALLGDMVRVIRLNRPIVVVSRFHGSPRDGHGHHHAAGLLTPEAVAAAADPARFPDQIVREGLRPWRVPRLYRGGVRLTEPQDVLVDANAYSPSLGATYQRWADRGLSLQRSQTSGRVRGGSGRTYRYERLDGGAAGGGGGVAGTGERAEVVAIQPGTVEAAGAGMADAFAAGLDTRLTGLPALVGERVAEEVAAALAEVQEVIDGVVRDFDFTAPEASVAGLARGLALLRAVTGGEGVPPEVGFQLAVKERQFEDAIVAAGGIGVVAELVAAGGGGGRAGGRAGGAGAGAVGAVVVPGEEVGVAVRVESAMTGRVEVVGVGTNMDLADSDVDAPAGPAPYVHRLTIRIPPDARPAGPYFDRSGLDESHYRVTDSTDLHLPWAAPALRAIVDLRVDGTHLSRSVAVTGSVPQLPYGSVTRRVDVLPALSVSVSPGVRVVAVGGPERERDGAAPAGGGGNPDGNAARPIEVILRVQTNLAEVAAEAGIELPGGWTASPAAIRHDFRSRGEAIETPVTITPPDGWRGEVVVHAVARATAPASPREHRTGHRVVDHRDLPLARLRIPARATIRSVPAASLDGVAVGYVMGVGDEVPGAIEALGASVHLLDESDLAGGDLDAHDAIVVGTRAYAVRRDLVDNNQRLIDYARRGGNLVVLYQTQEFVPSEMAPHPATLPPGAQEVSEEDAPVRLLAPSHPLLASPNRIVEADFDGWLEQRGSKFFAEWGTAYTPLVETHDTGQSPQRGVWLAATAGAGRYGYVALALHRQLPYGVPGAYRILSNLLWPRPASR